jgi:hypothetical protein
MKNTAQTTPGYWMHETGEELQPAVVAYLNDLPLTSRQVALIRAYLRQWIEVDGWAPSSALVRLRSSVNEIQTPQDICAWISQAEEEGIDTL